MSLLAPEKLLQQGGQRLGLHLKKKQVNQLLTYLNELKRWNRRVNLTALTTNQDIIERHFLDSLMGVKTIRPYQDLKLMDIGTGAGFPGIPIKLYYPEILLTLVEPVHKKAAFLHHLCGVLRLKGVSVLAERVEGLHRSPEHRGVYQVIVTRAFAKPKPAIKSAVPFLAPAGRLVLYMSRSGEERWHLEQGWKSETLDYRLPFSDVKRSIVVMVHTG